MTEHASVPALTGRDWVKSKLFLGLSFGDYVKSLITPGNLVVGLIMAVGLPLIVYRFAYGLGASTNLTQTSPWGIWIGFDMLSGVALAAGGYTLATSVYIFGLEKYHPVVRPAVLTGFLGYLFAILGLAPTSAGRGTSRSRSSSRGAARRSCSRSPGASASTPRSSSWNSCRPCSSGSAGPARACGP